MKTYYGYRIYYKDKEYTGIHSSYKTMEDLIKNPRCDGYFGSGRVIKDLRKSNKKYKELLHKEILVFKECYEELLNWEKDTVDEDYVKREDTLNIVIGGIQTRDNKIFFGRIPSNKGKKGLQIAHNKGVPMSEEQYEKCSKTMFRKGKESWNKGKENYWQKGIPRSEEVKRKISETKRLNRLKLVEGIINDN